MDGLLSDQQLVQALCKWTKQTPTQVARDIGAAVTTISRPYKGLATSRLSQPTLEKLKSHYPEFPGWKNELPDQIGMRGERADPNEKPEELAYIREVDISYAMGDGSEIDQYPATGLIPFNLNFIRHLTRTDTDQLFIATGHGESMEPTLLRSDTIMIDTSVNRVSQQDMIWALSYAGAGMIKRLRRIRTSDGDRIEILSDNPIVPSTIALPEDVFIIGKVIWIGRQMG